MYSYSDDAYYTKGTHSLKFGAQVHRYRWDDFTNISKWGTWGFNSVESLLQAGPEATTNLLVYMASTEARDVFLQSLPIGNLDGTLKRRFSRWSAATRVHAKTGSLSHVSSLAGYLDHPARGLLAFSLMVNNANAPVSEIRAGIDRLVKELLE